MYTSKLLYKRLMVIAVVALMALAGLSRFVSGQQTGNLDCGRNQEHVSEELSDEILDLVAIFNQINSAVAVMKDPNSTIADIAIECEKLGAGDLDLSLIKDKRVVTTIQGVTDELNQTIKAMSGYAFFQEELQEHVRWSQRECARRIYGEILGSVGMSSSGVSYIGLTSGLLGAGKGIANAYWEYDRMLNEIKTKHREEEFRLENEKRERINGISSRLLENTWEILVKDHPRAEELRISDKNYVELNSIAKIKAPRVRLSRLLNEERALCRSSRYWLDRAENEYQVKDYESSLRSLNKFRKYHRKIFRKDSDWIGASASAVEVAVLLSSRKEFGPGDKDRIRMCLASIENCLGWYKRKPSWAYLCAMAYANVLGNKQRAKDIMDVIDVGDSLAEEFNKLSPTLKYVMHYVASNQFELRLPRIFNISKQMKFVLQLSQAGKCVRKVGEDYNNRKNYETNEVDVVEMHFDCSDDYLKGIDSIILPVKYKEQIVNLFFFPSTGFNVIEGSHANDEMDWQYVGFEAENERHIQSADERSNGYGEMVSYYDLASEVRWGRAFSLKTVVTSYVVQFNPMVASYMIYKQLKDPSADDPTLVPLEKRSAEAFANVFYRPSGLKTFENNIVKSFEISSSNIIISCTNSLPTKLYVDTGVTLFTACGAQLCNITTRSMLTENAESRVLLDIPDEVKRCYPARWIDLRVFPSEQTKLEWVKEKYRSLRK